MATFKDIIDRVLANVGDTRTGTTLARARILVDLETLQEIDIKGSAGGPYKEGSATVTLDGSKSDGAYDVPSTMRSVNGPFLLDNTIWTRSSIYRDPGKFFLTYQLTPTGADAKPFAVLVHALKFTFRPIPDAGQNYIFTVFGTTWSDPSIVEGTTVRQEFEAILESGGTMLHAARTDQDTIAARYGVLFERRLSNFRGGAQAWLREAAGETGYL